MDNKIFLNIIDDKVFSYMFQNNNKFDDNKTKEDVKLIQSLCILSFDDLIGQIAENVYPENSLDKLSIKQITGLGFPETNSLCEDGEIIFTFKIRKSIYTYNVR